MQTFDTRRIDGYAPLANYVALSDGRSVALVAADGSIDWWCAPNMDSPPLFDRLLDAPDGGYFSIRPVHGYTVTRAYKQNSNVPETVFKTDTGTVRLTESLNSGSAGRLPWSELARRIEGLEGEVTLQIELKPGARGQTVSPWIRQTPNGEVMHVDGLMAMFCYGEEVVIQECNDRFVRAQITVKKGMRTVVALTATENEPLPVPTLDEIDQRIDRSDIAWREWAEGLQYEGKFKSAVLRSALALKLLLYSPSGAIVAAPTCGLPERIGGDKNYEYRYAWIRDAVFTIKAFLRVGAMAEAQAALAWLQNVIRRHGNRLHTCFTLEGDKAPEEHLINVPGYRNSTPVRVGNRASYQCQLSLYGDLLETVLMYVEEGHILDYATSGLLVELANLCADQWRCKDAGMWELEELQHYTMSKLGCWFALDRAVKLAQGGHIPDAMQERWGRERDRIRDWIDEHCWSETKQSYTFYAGTDRLDAGLLLAIRFGFEGKERLIKTCEAIRNELSRGPLIYRYTGVEKEEGAFLACSFWLVEAYAVLGDGKRAHALMEDVLAAATNSIGLMTEMVDPETGDALGNLPQGLSHLAMIHATLAINDPSQTEA
jgi:GH15 family glucan-1,4-alpha-glucosidase